MILHALSVDFLLVPHVSLIISRGPGPWSAIQQYERRKSRRDLGNQGNKIELVPILPIFRSAFRSVGVGDWLSWFQSFPSSEAPSVALVWGIG